MIHAADNDLEVIKTDSGKVFPNEKLLERHRTYDVYGNPNLPRKVKESIEEIVAVLDDGDLTWFQEKMIMKRVI